MNWIKCSKNMPKHLEKIIFCYKDEFGYEILTGYYDALNNGFTCNIVGFLIDISDEVYDQLHFKKNITHWMPFSYLPENE